MYPENESQIKDFDLMRRMINKAVFDAVDRAKRCCINCASFDEPKMYCRQHKGNPPPRVVVFGCDSYVPSDEIPF